MTEPKEEELFIPQIHALIMAARLALLRKAKPDDAEDTFSGEAWERKRDEAIDYLAEAETILEDWF